MMPAHNFHRGLFPALAETTRAWYPMVRVGALCAVGFASGLIAGCGELEPVREPERVELELTTDTLKASVRDAQRMIAELRADLEAQRRELAEAQIARAQLEGQVREAERRIIEARQVIEFQREELATVRSKRAHAFQGSLPLQGRKKETQTSLSRTRHSGPVRDRSKAVSLPSGGGMPVSAQHNQTSELPETPQMVVDPAALLPVPANGTSSSALERREHSLERVSVKSGDTLWSIAQKYHVNVEHLRTFNQLTDNRILIGQALRLPDDQPLSTDGADKGTPTP
jgi:LysM repeat protein